MKESNTRSLHLLTINKSSYSPFIMKKIINLIIDALETGALLIIGSLIIAGLMLLKIIIFGDM